MELFVREIQNENKYQEFVNQVSWKLNLTTLTTFSTREIAKFFSIEYEQEYLVYRFRLLNDWRHLNERYSREYIKKFEELIDRLMLNEHLNGFEEDYLDHYNQVVFAKNRNLKNLIVDFDICFGERVYFKFDFTIFGKYLGNDGVQIIYENNEIYITTERIVVMNKETYYSIYYDEIKLLKLRNYFFEIRTSNNLIFYLFSPDLYPFYVSLERILAICKIRI